jgi:hypothetical protein
MKRACATILVIAFVLLSTSLALAEKEQLSKGQYETNAKVHWYIVVCSSAADVVSLQVGTTKDDMIVMKGWKQGEGQKAIAIPDKYQVNNSIYVQLTNSPADRQTEACVGWNGGAKKAIHFREVNWNGQVWYSDWANDCACR